MICDHTEVHSHETHTQSCYKMKHWGWENGWKSLEMGKTWFGNRNLKGILFLLSLNCFLHLPRLPGPSRQMETCQPSGFTADLNSMPFPTISPDVWQGIGELGRIVCVSLQPILGTKEQVKHSKDIFFKDNHGCSLAQCHPKMPFLFWQFYGWVKGEEMSCLWGCAPIGTTESQRTAHRYSPEHRCPVPT